MDRRWMWSGPLGSGPGAPSRYDFTWESSASVVRTVPGGRVNADGSVTPFETVRSAVMGSGAPPGGGGRIGPGDAARPSTFELAFTGSGRCNTLCDTWERHLVGRGVLVTQAVEPPALAGVALALLAALATRRRRRD